MSRVSECPCRILQREIANGGRDTSGTPSAESASGLLNSRPSTRACSFTRRPHFQVPYAATPLFATLLSRAEPRDTKTAGGTASTARSELLGVWRYSFHFGTRCAQSNGQLSKREEMGTGARGAPVPEVGHYVKIKRAQSRKSESRPNEGRVNSP
jgi:hypothetical protein